MEIQEKNKTCDCTITQSRPSHYIETCKCEFDADFNEKKNKCMKKNEKLEYMNPHAETVSPQQNNACCSQPAQQQHVQPQQQRCEQQVAAPVQQQNCGCTEDPYAALGNCVQQCMIEKGQLAQSCGVKCPDCAAPADDQAEKIQVEDGAKDGKGDKAAAKGGKGDKAAAKGDKGKKKKGGK